MSSDPTKRSRPMSAAEYLRSLRGDTEIQQALEEDQKENEQSDDSNVMEVEKIEEEEEKEELVVLR